MRSQLAIFLHGISSAHIRFNKSSCNAGTGQLRGLARDISVTRQVALNPITAPCIFIELFSVRTVRFTEAGYHRCSLNFAALHPSYAANSAPPNIVCGAVFQRFRTYIFVQTAAFAQFDTGACDG